MTVKGSFRLARVGLLAAMLSGAAPAASACGLELILAMDVSRSVVNAEYDLQMGGLAAAFRSAEVIEAIEWTPGGIMVTVTQWSGPRSQSQSVPWAHVSTAVEALAFADAIDNQQREFFAAYTAIGEALYHAARVSDANPKQCQRKVIDVSGDGHSNRGRPARPVAEALAVKGYTVNGLVIEGALGEDLVEFYLRNVTRGPGSFVEVADGFEDYARAIRVKLVREMTPQLAAR
ncbi:MAG: DUF1194 domain-containing protein [Pseudomonadota bacterium]